MEHQILLLHSHHHLSDEMQPENAASVPVGFEQKTLQVAPRVNFDR
jgi:hypothetical protein